MTPDELALARESNELEARDTALRAALQLSHVRGDPHTSADELLDEAREIFAFLMPAREMKH